MVMMLRCTWGSMLDWIKLLQFDLLDSCKVVSRSAVTQGGEVVHVQVQSNPSQVQSGDSDASLSSGGVLSDSHDAALNRRHYHYSASVLVAVWKATTQWLGVGWFGQIGQNLQNWGRNWFGLVWFGLVWLVQMLVGQSQVKQRSRICTNVCCVS